ncbi:hypothetical protein [Pedobacter frigoris]|uniref:Uncharacterized protein n=1 Tax=Pedobacter frigoris TaxID=2571272 RepID=A0A4U1CD15_9SPHI|nr:hypothetical protein [Pedobacter frigoris]TKC03962.1 hypothetical protein FA047_18640 [Pedobacter frigoris]
MDRLIIEATFEDVNEISLLKNNNALDPNATLVLGFKIVNTDQVIHAFSTLKKIAVQHSFELVICKTMNARIYDIELKTNGLDEPVRINNKAITNETLGSIEDEATSKTAMRIGLNVSPEENWIPVTSINIKNCEITS